MLFVSKREGGAGVWVGRTVYTGRDETRRAIEMDLHYLEED